MKIKTNVRIEEDRYVFGRDRYFHYREWHRVSYARVLRFFSLYI